MLFPLLLPALQSTMPEFSNAKLRFVHVSELRTSFHVIWPDPLPSYCDPCSKIKIKCPDCQEVTELYDFLIDKIIQAPEPVSRQSRFVYFSRDPNPDPKTP